MYHKLNISPDETIYYRYNPEADVLALRLTPDFGPAVEAPLPDLPEATLSRDAASGAVVGLRVSGVQQLILDSLVRDLFGRARRHLETPGPTGTARAAPAPHVPEPSAPPPAFATPMDPSPGPGPALATDQEARPAGRRRRRRGKRGSARQDSVLAADAGGDVPYGYPEDAAETIAGADLVPIGVEADHAELGVVASDALAPIAIEPAEAAPIDVDTPSEAESIVAAPIDAESPEVMPSEAPLGDLEPSPAAIEDLEPASARIDDLAPAPAAIEVPLPAVPAPPEVAAVDADRGAQGSGGFRAFAFDARLHRAIATLGFQVPTPIQVEALPAALGGRDVVGLAQTGTGKTLVFAAAGLQRLLGDADTRHRPRMLVLAPTRELAVQVARATEDLARFSGLRVSTIYGGVAMGQQIQELKAGPDVIVATPGRLLDHLRRRNVRLDEIQMLVLDEADRMLDMGFLPDVRTILRHLPAERQTLFFSATMPPEVESLSMEFQRQPLAVEIARRMPPAQIEQVLYPLEGRHLKVPLLVHLLRSDPEMTSVLVFTERKVDADVLARQLRQGGVKVALMHGDRRQSDRERALQALGTGAVRALVATDIAARGLDIADISHVVNYDCPDTVDEYVHRIGRTARAEAKGKAYTFVTLADEAIVARIEAALGRALPRAQAEGFDYDVPVPTWAKPSARDVMAMLDRDQSVVDRLRGLARRR